MIGLYILLAHLVGDYVLQTDWMAQEKTKRWTPAILHGIVYTLPYLFITQSWAALLVIAGTHIIIDRFRLAKHIGWFKNQFAPKSHRPEWAGGKYNGYSQATPVWMSTWLMIITDNTMHLIINILAVIFLGGST